MKEPILCYVSGDTAYFTTQELSQQTGDDWNDSPYEHNAGEPYSWHEGYNVPPYVIVTLKFTTCLKQPCDDYYNSPYSVDMINQGAIAWLRLDYLSCHEGCRPILAGATINDFRRLIWLSGGDIYELVEPDKDYS